MSKIMLVGECNPYGDDPEFALYPAPDGCSGERLCRLILGMHCHDYLDAFERANLCTGKWSIKAARKRLCNLLSSHDRIVLLGSKVCSAFGVPFTPFTVLPVGPSQCLVLPHPSGLCRLWAEVNAIALARSALARFAPELADIIGIRAGDAAP